MDHPKGGSSKFTISLPGPLCENHHTQIATPQSLKLPVYLPIHKILQLQIWFRDNQELHEELDLQWLGWNDVHQLYTILPSLFWRSQMNPVMETYS